MPIAAYSGSYHPAPIPTSSRPSHTTSRLASAFASTAAGRNASHSTNVPRRTRVTSPASAAKATIGSRHPSRSGGPPYLATSRKRWSDSQSESNPAASAARAHSTTRAQGNGDSPATE